MTLYLLFGGFYLETCPGVEKKPCSQRTRSRCLGSCRNKNIRQYNVILLKSYIFDEPENVQTEGQTKTVKWMRDVSVNLN